MSSQQPDDQHDDLPAELSQPARRALAGAGYTRLEQLSRARPSELRKLHGMGPKGIRQLRDALERNGRTFLDERP